MFPLNRHDCISTKTKFVNSSNGHTHRPHEQLKEKEGRKVGISVTSSNDLRRGLNEKTM